MDPLVRSMEANTRPMEPVSVYAKDIGKGLASSSLSPVSQANTSMHVEDEYGGPRWEGDREYVQSRREDVQSSQQSFLSDEPRSPTTSVTGGDQAGSGGRSRPSSRPRSAPRTPRKDGCGNELLVLASVRKHLENFAEQMRNEMQTHSQHRDRITEAGSSRIDMKTSVLESKQVSLERNLAEMRGNYKGISDEVQGLLRRVDQLDVRNLEWQRHFSEENEKKHRSTNQTIQQHTACARVEQATREEMHKKLENRVNALNLILEEKDADEDERNRTLKDLQIKQMELKEGIDRCHRLCSETPYVKQAPMNPMVDHGMLKVVEDQIQELTRKLELFHTEVHDTCARLEQQEESQKTLRTKCDGLEMHYRVLWERMVRGDWDLKIKNVTEMMEDYQKYKGDDAVKHQIFQQRLQGHEEQLELTRSMVRDMNTKIQVSVNEDGLNVMDETESTYGDDRELQDRLCEQEKRLEVLEQSLEIGPRVKALVEQLRYVCPKVVGHEESIKDLNAKLSAVESKIDTRDNRTNEFAVATGVMAEPTASAYRPTSAVETPALLRPNTMVETSAHTDVGSGPTSNRPSLNKGNVGPIETISTKLPNSAEIGQTENEGVSG